MKLRINQLSTLLGLSHTTIIYYEKRNIIHPVRLENGYREYSFEDIMTLKKVIILRNLNLSSKEIEKIIQDKEWDMEQVLISQSKKIKNNIQKELRLISLIDDALNLRDNQYEIMQVEPFFITKKPTCNTEHTIISDNPSAKELIRMMPFSFFHWTISAKDILEENDMAIKHGLDMTYRGIRLDDAIINDVNTEGLKLISSFRCIRIVVPFNRMDSEILKIKSILLKHDISKETQILFRSSTVFTAMYDDGKKDSLGEIFIPL